jgi:hypothetical protein
MTNRTATPDVPAWYSRGVTPGHPGAEGGPHDTGYKTPELARIDPGNNLLVLGPPRRA